MAAQSGAAGASQAAGQASATANLAALTLDAAIRTALERNPDLSIARKIEGVSLAASEVSRTYPYNPHLQTDVRPYSRESGGKHGDVFFEAAILQEIEIAGQSRHRSKASAADAAQAQWALRKIELQVIGETERRFFGAIYWRERRELDETMARLKEELLGITERRFDAGLSVASDVALARIEAQSARQQLELTGMRQDAALVDLRKNLGAPRESVVVPVGSLTAMEWTAPRGTGIEVSDPARTPQPTEDLGALAGARPDVKLGEAGREAARSRVDLASSEQVPNITLGPVYERDESGTNFLGFKLELPIPIFSTGGPIVRQRQAELEESLESLNQLRWKARAELDAAMARYEKAFRLAARFRGDLMEGLERDIQRVMSQYDAGIASLLEAYAARDKMMQARQNNLDALYELALSAADLSEAAALPPQTFLKSLTPSQEPRK